MGKRKFFLFFFLYSFRLFCQADSLLTFSEIMFYSQGSNNEFIEVFNLSQTDSIDLSNYKIIYSTSSPDIIVPLAKSVLLPQTFAIILEGDYDFTSGIYNSIIPTEAIIFKINNNAFGASGLANTSDRTIYLLDTQNDTLDVYTYSANNSTGISDEKINFSKDNSSSNWKNSINLNGTPGKVNSVFPVQNNISITSVNVIPTNPKQFETIEIKATIKNTGKFSQNNIEVKLYDDLNNDSVFTQSEIIDSTLIIDLSPKDSAIVTLEFTANQSKKYSMEIIAFAETDEDSSDNVILFSITVHPPAAKFNDLVINELMYSPQNDEPEWVELYNRSKSVIDISGWKILDKTTQTVITNIPYQLAAGDFLILTHDATITSYYDSVNNYIVLNLPTLNNTGDDIVVRDFYGNIIDSISYKSSWGRLNGVSLERINSDLPTNDSSNWKSSQSIYRATPGKENSISLHSKDLIIKNVSDFQPYYEYGRTIPLDLKIVNIGLQTITGFYINIYSDSDGNNKIDVSELIEHFSFMPNKELNAGDSVIIKIDISNYSTGKNNLIFEVAVDQHEYSENNFIFGSINVVKINEVRNDLVINEIMYSPANQQPEWIEIFNRSQKEINLKGYQIADNSMKSKVVINTIIIEPNEFYVVSKDSSLLFNYDIDKVIISNFPSLNNSSDKIILLDSLNRIIDSVYYFSSWGGNSGKSLERIDVDATSNNIKNWGSCIDELKATPGKKNSVSKRNYDAEIKKMRVIPEKPFVGSEFNFSSVVSNVGKLPIQLKVFLYEINQQDSSQINNLEESVLLTINPGDSIEYLPSYKKTMDGNTHSYLFAIESLLDENNSNDKISVELFPAFSNKSILVNEIMFSPINGEPEWFEIYNSLSCDINLKSFSVSDILSSPIKNELVTYNLILPSNNYLVIAKDSSIFSYHNKIDSKAVISKFANLNNDYDGIVLYDYYNSIIDSVLYDFHWGGTDGHSLERISFGADSNDSTNWISSNDEELSTPGKINSASIKNYDLSLSTVNTYPQFPKADEDFIVSTKIFNIGKFVAENTNVAFELIHEKNKRIFHSFEINELKSGDSITINSLPINIQSNAAINVRCLFNADEDTSNNFKSILIYPSANSKSVVVSEFYPYPNSNEVEWIELFNTSDKIIDIGNWKIGDLLPTPKISMLTGTNHLMNSNEYFLVSPDTTLLNSNTKKLRADFGNLGSVEDGIILFDGNGNLVDSLSYTKTITIKKGKSIERNINALLTDNTELMHYSLSENGNSLGSENSIMQITQSQPSSIIINEIMFDPAINNSEFIELFNVSDTAINIGGWSLEDETHLSVDLSEINNFIPAGEYFAISSDSLIFNYYDYIDSSKIFIQKKMFTLSNESKLIFVKDFWGNVIDSVHYSSKWHNESFQSTKNISLERINPKISTSDKNNWSSCVAEEGATPARQNSILTNPESNSKKITIAPNPFSPDNDGFEDFAIITINLASSVSQLRVRIFDDKGRLRRTIADNIPVSFQAKIVFDGRDSEGRLLNIGMYIVLVEASDFRNKTISTMKKVVVIARKL